MTIQTPPMPAPSDPGSIRGTSSAGRSSFVLRHSSFVDWLVVALIVAYLAALLPGLTRFPPLINDEGREANLFWVAARADPAAERMNAHRGFPTWGTGGVQGATTAILFRLGGVGVFQARLTSLLWGGVLLLLVYLLGRQYWNRAVGLTAAILLAVSPPFLLSTHTLRPDIQVVTLVAGALLLAETAIRGGRGWMALAAGLLFGLGVDTHPNTLGMVPLVALVFPLHQGWLGRGFLQRREFWLFGAGLALGAAYYLGVRVLPDPAGFHAAASYWLGVDKAPPVARGGLGLVGMVGNELARYWEHIGEEPLELALIIAGLAAGAWWSIRGSGRDSHPSRLILLGLVAQFAFFAVAVAMKSKFYLVLTYPLYLLLVARLLERAAEWVGQQTVRPEPALGRASSTVVGVVLAGLVVLAMLGPLRAEDRAWDNYIHARRYREGQEYTLLTQRLAALAGPGARILAPPVYWIGLKDHPYVDMFVYERLERQHGMSVGQFLDETRPDFVITDGKIATEKRVERAIFAELDARATREMVVRHKSYGDVVVYRLRW